MKTFWPIVLAAFALLLSACSQPEMVSELIITSEPFPLLVGTAQTIELRIEPERFRSAVVWSSSNEEVALVDENGIAFGLADGTTTIRAALRGNRALFDEIEIEVITGLMDTPSKAFALEIDTTSLVENGTMWPFELGLMGTGTIVVAWGDGAHTVHTNPSQPIPHTYADARTYTITVVGTLEQASLSGAPGFRNPGDPVPAQYALRRLISWGEHEFISLASAFESAMSLTQVPDYLPPTVTDLTATFAKTKQFHQSLENWDTGNVTSMRRTFWGASEYNQPLASWNTSEVTNMSQMFYGAASFNQSLANWDTGKVTNMDQMFNLAVKFYDDLSGWCVENIPREPIQFYHLPAIFAFPMPSWGAPCN